MRPEAKGKRPRQIAFKNSEYSVVYPAIFRHLRNAFTYHRQLTVAFHSAQAFNSPRCPQRTPNGIDAIGRIDDQFVVFQCPHNPLQLPFRGVLTVQLHKHGSKIRISLSKNNFFINAIERLWLDSPCASRSRLIFCRTQASSTRPNKHKRLFHSAEMRFSAIKDGSLFSVVQPHVPTIRSAE